VRIEWNPVPLVGYGEAAPLPGFGGGDPEQVREVLARLGEALRELVATRSGAVGPDELAEWRKAAAALAPMDPAARAAMEFALVDVMAQAAGIPLSRWLTEMARESVEVNGVIGAVPAEAAAARATALVTEGFGTIKIKVGTGLAADVARVEAVCRAVGDQTRLRLDANGAWSPAEAVAALAALAEFTIELVEQPVPAEDVDGLAWVRRRATILVAADEALLRDGGPEAVLAAGAADYLVLKPSLLGGPLAALDLARRAAATGVACYVTTALESAVGRMGALHVAAALPPCRAKLSDAPGPAGGSALRQPAHGLATGELVTDDVGRTPLVVGGRMTVPTAAGLGLGEVAGPWEPMP